MRPILISQLENPQGRDPPPRELKDQVSGAVMVQVPSDEVLGVEQSIASELDQAEKIGQQKEIEGMEYRSTNVSKL